MVDLTAFNGLLLVETARKLIALWPIAPINPVSQKPASPSPRHEVVGDEAEGVVGLVVADEEHRLVGVPDKDAVALPGAEPDDPVRQAPVLALLEQLLLAEAVDLEALAHADEEAALELDHGLGDVLQNGLCGAKGGGEEEEEAIIAPCRVPDCDWLHTNRRATLFGAGQIPNQNGMPRGRPAWPDQVIKGQHSERKREEEGKKL